MPRRLGTGTLVARTRMDESEFAKGGIIETDYSTWSVDAILDSGCTYVLPPSLAKKWREQLDRLNEGMLD